MRTFSLGAGKDTVVFADTTTNNGVDTITGFTAGAGGDVLDLSNFTAAAGDLQKADSRSGTLTLADNGNSISIFYNNTDGKISTSDVIATSGGGGDAGKIIVANTKKAVVLVTTGDAGSTDANTYNVYYVTGNSLAAAKVELVGSVSTDAAALVIGNFA